MAEKAYKLSGQRRKRCEVSIYTYNSDRAVEGESANREDFTDADHDVADEEQLHFPRTCESGTNITEGRGDVHTFGRQQPASSLIVAPRKWKRQWQDHRGQ